MHGVIRVQDYDELLEVAHLLAHTPKPRVPGIAVVSHSGGISSLTADMCGQAGLDLPTLGDVARDGINGIPEGEGLRVGRQSRRRDRLRQQRSCSRKIMEHADQRSA